MKVAFFDRLIDVEVRTKRIKHTYIHNKGSDRLLVTSNARFDQDSLTRLLEQNRHKVENLLKTQARMPLSEAGSIIVFGEKVPVVFERRERYGWDFDQGTVFVYGTDEEHQKAALESFYGFKVKEAAIEELERLDRTVALHLSLAGITFKSKRLKSRLGSYSRKTRTVMLNALLGRFERKYLRIILIHELVHSKVSGHQKDFYRLLLAIVPDYRKQKKELTAMIRQYEV